LSAHGIFKWLSIYGFPCIHFTNSLKLIHLK
jgi:hypothetical protein